MALAGTKVGTAPTITTPGPSSDAVVLLPYGTTIIEAFSPTRTFGPYADVAGNVYVSAVFPCEDGGCTGTGFVKIKPDHTMAWKKDYDPNWVVSDGKVDPAGNTVIEGTLLSPSPLDTSQKAVTVKYAPDGSVAWSKQYQLGDKTAGFALALGADGSVVALGSSSIPGQAGGQGILFLVKYAADGTQQWTKSYCYGGLPRSAAIDADGNIYTSLQGTPGSIAKFTADGAALFMRSFGGPRDTGELVFSPDSQALYLFAAESAVGTTVGLRRLDPKTGDVLWAMNVGTSTAFDDPSPGVSWSGMLGNRDQMAITADTIYVAGTYSNSFSSASVTSAFVTFVAGYDPTTGQQKWFQQIQMSNKDGGLLGPFLGGIDTQPYLGVDPAGNAIVLDAQYPSITNKTVIWKMTPAGAYTAF